MSHPVSSAMLSNMIGAIYDAAVDPTLWPAAMALMCKGLDFNACMLGLQEFPSCRRILSVTYGLDQAWWDRFELLARESVDWWGGMDVLEQQSAHEPVSLSRVNPTTFQPNTLDPFYNNFVKPLRLSDTVSVLLGREARWMALIGFGRHEAAGPTPASVIDTLRQLTPHLQRAATINQLLNAQALAKATFEAVLDALTTPTIVVDQHLVVLFANEAGRAALAQGDPLAVRGSFLTASGTGIRTALATAVAQCVASEGSLGRKGLRIPLRSAYGPPQVIHVMPLHRGPVRPLLRPGAAAAIFLAAAGTPQAPSEVVGSLFGLTDAETRVFACIVGGVTVVEAAGLLGVGTGTVRTHLRRI
ncbi:MAG TPA: hypothetical protein VJU34_11355, partial [Phenylobacterium sp.]|nr:hypothetical protein [Phenylobacterium sp.]